jgi:2-methylcitrate dehydratase
MDKATQELCRYATALEFEALPPETVHDTKRKLIDALGCAIAGFDDEPSRIARAIARRSIGKPPARIFGTQQLSTPEHAGFATGVLVRGQVYNDSYLSKASCHPSDTIPGVLALADATGASGRDVIAATVLAYEVACNFSDVLTREQGFDNTFFDVVATAVAGARLLGLSAEQTAHAIALAVTPNITLAQTRLGDLSMWKGCAAGNAVRNGVCAAIAAQQGRTGPDQPIEGRWGLRHVLGEIHWAPFGGRGGPFRITKTHLKYFPAVVHAQSPVSAALELYGKVNVDDVRSIAIDSYWVAKRYSDPTRASLWNPTTRETADHSIPYVVAAALLDGDLTEAAFTPQRIADPRLRDLMTKIVIREKPEFTAAYPDGWPCRIEIETKNGERKVADVKYFRGHAQTPLSDAEVETKFRRLTGDFLDAERSAALLRAIGRLDEVTDIRSVLELVEVKPSKR